MIYDRTWKGTPDLNMNDHLTTILSYCMDQMTSWRLGHQEKHDEQGQGTSSESEDEQGPVD